MLARCIVVVMVVARIAQAGDIFEPAPEAPGAVTDGAAAVKDAVKLGKDPAQHRRALDAFIDIARKWPAALHDCYLSLAYLRVGKVTEAKLVFDRATTRGAARPKWCTGDLAGQLDRAVHDGNWSEVRVDAPHGALVTIEHDVELKGFATVWMPCSKCGKAGSGPTIVIGVDLAGFQHWEKQVQLYSELTLVTAQLQPEITPVRMAPPPPPPPPPIDAHVDAGVEVAPPARAEQPPAEQLPPPEPSEAHVPGTKLHGKQLALVTAGVGVVGGAVAGFFTFVDHGDANRLYPTDPAFPAARDQWQTMGLITIGCGVLVVASLITYMVLPAEPPARVTIGATPGGAALTFGGQW